MAGSSFVVIFAQLSQNKRVFISLFRLCGAHCILVAVLLLLLLLLLITQRTVEEEGKCVVQQINMRMMMAMKAAGTESFPAQSDREKDEGQEQTSRQDEKVWGSWALGGFCMSVRWVVGGNGGWLTGWMVWR